MSAMRRSCRCFLLFTCWLVFVTPLREQEMSRPFTVVFYLPEFRCYCNLSVNVSDISEISGKHPAEVRRKDVIWGQKVFATSARHSI